MLQDTDLFEKLEQWLTLGDVHARVSWTESPSPDERYEVAVSWTFRSKNVGGASFVIEPILGTDQFRLYWISLTFIDDWQGKGLYTDIVKQIPVNVLPYGIIKTIAQPLDKEAERRLASQGFEWEGVFFTLDHNAVAARLRASEPGN